MFFTHFNFMLSCRPGSRNIQADLSPFLRHLKPKPEIHPPLLLLHPIIWDIEKEITNTLAHWVPTACPLNWTFIPSHLQRRLISWAHTIPATGPQAVTASMIYSRPSTDSQIRCLRSRVMSPLALYAPILQCIWSHLTIDFLTDLLESGLNTVIRVIFDWFSISLWLIPLPGIPTAFETAKLLFNYVLCYYGIPEDITSDCGTQFTSQVWSSFMEKLEVSVSLTAGYHPQSNGLNMPRTCWVSQPRA